MNNLAGREIAKDSPNKNISANCNRPITNLIN